jgi:hypothetical protein
MQEGKLSMGFFDISTSLAFIALCFGEFLAQFVF